VSLAPLALPVALALALSGSLAQRDAATGGLAPPEGASASPEPAQEEPAQEPDAASSGDARAAAPAEATRSLEGDESLAAWAARLDAAGGLAVQVQELDGAAPRLTLRSGDAGAARPAFVLCGDVPSHRQAFEALALGVDADTAALRERVVVHFLALPAAVLADTDGAVVSFASDFPVGWAPTPLRADAGEAPLTRADSRALATLLREEPSVVALVLPPPSLIAPRLVVAPFEHSTLAPPTPSGRPQDYAWYTLGIPSFALPLDGSDPSAVFAAAPRLELTVDGVAALGDGQWRVDLTLRNEGRLPTFTTPAQRWRVAEGLALEVAGVRVVAAASADPSATTHALVRGRTLEDGWRLPMRPLAGGDGLALRLVLAAEEGTGAALAARSAWAAPQRLDVPLVP